MCVNLGLLGWGRRGRRSVPFNKIVSKNQNGMSDTENGISVFIKPFVAGNVVDGIESKIQRIVQTVFK